MVGARSRYAAKVPENFSKLISLFQGNKDHLDEINVQELTTIKEDDFRQYGEEDFECEYDGGYDE